jgi:hypothetical protein
MKQLTSWNIENNTCKHASLEHIRMSGWRDNNNHNATKQAQNQLDQITQSLINL